MKGRRLNAREEVVFHLAKAGYGQQDIADLIRTASALRGLYVKDCNEGATGLRNATIRRRRREVLYIVSDRNKLAPGEQGLRLRQDVHEVAFPTDPRGAVVILHTADGTEDSASWRIRL